MESKSLDNKRNAIRNRIRIRMYRKKIKTISFTGHSINNPLSKISDLSLWINSKAYNFIENTHQLWLLTVCDLIIGKREYSAKRKD